jgi:hypothetical protein
MLTDFSFRDATRVFILLFFMVAGLYLALSSIITLSYIDNTKESKVPIVQRFDSSFKSMQKGSVINTEQLQKLDSLSGVAWAAFKDLNHLKSNHGLSGEALNNYRRNLEFALKTFTQHMGWLNNQKSLTINRFNKYNQALKASYTQASVHFNEQINKLPPNLLSSYSEGLTNFLMQLPYEAFFVNSLNSYTTNHLLFMQAINTANNDLVTVRNELLAGQHATDAMAIHNLPREEDYKYVEQQTVKLNAPKPGTLGEDWGIFMPFIKGFAASRNIDVLLLLGMIGFGLFGSAITLYVTTKEDEDKKKKVGHNVMLVLVRGFSATVVVFLAIRGGIAILNTGSNNPNPLVLFLFCFIGSVFSEPIWEWAKQKVDNTFPRNSNGNGVPDKVTKAALVDGKLTARVATEE